MKLTIHTFCWNEARLVPYFLRHYTADWVEKIVVYDDNSTDDSVKLLKQSPLVELRPMAVRPGQIINFRMMELREAAVVEARDQGVKLLYVPDFDEFLWHNDIAGFLERVYAADWPVIRPFGWNMIHPYFPRTSGKITDEVTRGYQNYWYSKPTLLRPDLVSQMRFHEGAHNANPLGWHNELLSIHNVGSAKILHFRYMGWPYYWATCNERSNRHADADPARRGRQHYDEAYLKQRTDFVIFLRDAVDLII